MAAFSQFESLARSFADVAAAGKPKTASGRGTLHLECDSEEIGARKSEWSDDVIVEPLLLRRSGVALSEALHAAVSGQGGNPAGTGVGASLTVRVVGGAQPAPGAKVMLVLSDLRGRSAGTRTTSQTNNNGEVSFFFDPSLWRPSVVAVEPAGGFWGAQAAAQDGMTINLIPLPMAGPLGWWSQLVGMSQEAPARAAGIKIGVVDTGVGPHPYLAHVRRLGAIINGSKQASPAAAADAVGHGTHVSGIIGARPASGSNGYAGIASGADLSVVRVFPPEGDANQGDIADAIDLLVEDGADLVNLSLGGVQPSSIELDAILLGLEQGTLCFASAGNEFGAPVMFPAAFAQTVAVSAVGVLGVAPSGSLAADSVPTDPSKFTRTGLYLANFSNVGSEVVCAAPGVGIISTVPAKGNAATPYAAMSGTSMASPMACGALATLLGQDAAYRGLPRGPERVERASAVLRASLRPVGLSPLYTGAGLATCLP